MLSALRKRPLAEASPKNVLAERRGQVQPGQVRERVGQCGRRWIEAKADGLGGEAELVNNPGAEGVRPHHTHIPRRTALLSIGAGEGGRIGKEVRRKGALGIGLAKERVVGTGGQVVCAYGPLPAQGLGRVRARKRTYFHNAGRTASGTIANADDTDQRRVRRTSAQTSQ